MSKEVQSNKTITQALAAEPLLFKNQAIHYRMYLLNLSHALTALHKVMATPSQQGRGLIFEHLQCVLHVSTFSQQPCGKYITQLHR